MYRIDVDWTSIKNFAQARGTSIQWTDFGGNYYISAHDGPVSLSTLIPQDNANNPDLIDFVNNYKNSSNLPLPLNANVQVQPPYGSKTIMVNGVLKKLYSRFTGIKYSVNNGSNTLTYTATYPWAKLLGVECIGCSSLDTADFKVFDNAQGTYSGVPNALLNQFSFALNLPDGFYQRFAQFDADLYAGMVIQITYVSVSSLTPKTIGINLLMDEVK